MHRTDTRLLFVRATTLVVCVALWGPALAATPDPSGGALTGGPKPRVIVTTDIGPGGDFDDEQSMVSALLFSDVIDYEAFIGTASTIREAIGEYEKDLPNLNTWSRFPSAPSLRALIYEGVPAVDRIIACARKTDTRPLWICVWGGLWEVAEAIKKAPDIRAKIRIYAIGRQGVGADYIENNLGNAWWIENLRSFQGVWDGWSGPWSNTAFVDTYVAGHGNLGAWYARQDDGIEWWQGFREGDSPSFLYLLRGNPDTPESDHWGGRFVKTSPGAYHWVDGSGSGYGEESISKYRLNYLGEYAKRFDWAKSANSTSGAADRVAPSSQVLHTGTRVQGTAYRVDGRVVPGSVSARGVTLGTNGCSTRVR